MQMQARAMNIIRSHMDEVSDANAGNKRLIDANALDEEVRNFFLAITGNPKQGTIVRECKKSFRRIIDEQPTVHADIDANALDEEVRNFFLAITGNPKQGTIVRECKKSFRRIIDEQPTVHADNGWIPVEERLPEEKG